MYGVWGTFRISQTRLQDNVLDGEWDFGQIVAAFVSATPLIPIVEEITWQFSRNGELDPTAVSCTSRDA
jgi:hypothetical protein